jgi:hypothetical protein
MYIVYVVYMIDFCLFFKKLLSYVFGRTKWLKKCSRNIFFFIYFAERYRDLEVNFLVLR